MVGAVHDFAKRKPVCLFGRLLPLVAFAANSFCQGSETVARGERHAYEGPRKWQRPGCQRNVAQGLNTKMWPAPACEHHTERGHTNDADPTKSTRKPAERCIDPRQARLCAARSNLAALK